MATLCVRMRIAIATQVRSCVRTRAAKTLVNVCVESLLKRSQTLYAYFQKTSKSYLPNPQGPLS
jgi:hypothetical protein